MAAAGLNHIPLYPEFRDCTAPSTERILEIFTNLAATNCTTMASSSRPSNPNSAPSNSKSSTYSASPTTYTQQRQLPR
jgi:hypothetical protein